MNAAVGAIGISRRPIAGALNLSWHDRPIADGSAGQESVVEGDGIDERLERGADLPGGRIVAHVGVGVLARVERVAVVANNHAQRAIVILALELDRARRIWREGITKKRLSGKGNAGQKMSAHDCSSAAAQSRGRVESLPAKHRRRHETREVQR